MDERNNDNPYAPPVETSDAFQHAMPVAQGGLTISGQGWEIVSSMAKWMRIVSTLQYVGGALIGVLGLIVVATGSTTMARSFTGGLRGGAAVALGGSILLVMSALFFFAATWLRQSARHFYDGVLSDAERPLADGFRKLRLYLILYGVYAMLSLLGDVLKLVGARLAGGISP